jgi:hypothetical protein
MNQQTFVSEFWKYYRKNNFLEPYELHMVHYKTGIARIEIVSDCKLIREGELYQEIKEAKPSYLKKYFDKIKNLSVSIDPNVAEIFVNGEQIYEK